MKIFKFLILAICMNTFANNFKVAYINKQLESKQAELEDAETLNEFLELSVEYSKMLNDLNKTFIQ